MFPKSLDQYRRIAHDGSRLREYTREAMSLSQTIRDEHHLILYQNSSPLPLSAPLNPILGKRPLCL